MSRAAQVSLHQTKIGRSKLFAQDPIDRKHQEEKICPTCLVQEDTEHYFLHCVKFSSQRHEMFSTIELTLTNETGHKLENIRHSLHFLAENKELSHKTRVNILFAIEKFLIDTKRLF